MMMKLSVGQIQSHESIHQFVIYTPSQGTPTWQQSAFEPEHPDSTHTDPPHTSR